MAGPARYLGPWDSQLPSRQPRSLHRRIVLNAYYRKDRRSYVYRFTFPEKGGEVYLKGGFRTRNEALTAARQRLTRLELGAEPSRDESTLTVGALWSLYDRHCRHQNQTREWRYSKEKTFHRRFASILTLPSTKVVTRDLQRCVDEAEGIGTYMRGELVKIAQAFFGWAFRSGYLTADPSVGLEKPQGNGDHPNSWKTKPFPADEDIDAVLAVATQDERDQLLVGRHTGSEPASLARIVWRDVDFERRDVKISRRKNKTGSLRYHVVPLSHDAVACLSRRYGDGKEPDEPVFPTIITDMRWIVLLRKASRAAGRQIAFGRAVFKHMFRTAIAARTGPGGLSVPDVQAITGCSWETLSKHYLKVDMRRAHAVVSDIFNNAPHCSSVRV